MHFSFSVQRLALWELATHAPCRASALGLGERYQKGRALLVSMIVWVVPPLCFCLLLE